MAITSLEIFRNKNITQFSCSNKLVKCSCDANGGLDSSEYDSKETRNISPHLNGDRFGTTEKKNLHKRTTDFISSFPLAVNIYKANSDQLRSTKQRSKKGKKSVLTLPNEQTPLPQACTVSDLNDSESFNENKVEAKSRPKKQRSIKNRNPVLTTSSRESEVFDTDTKYYRNISQYTGDGQKVKKSHRKSDVSNKINVMANDVWSVLRDINKFQFRLTPSMSQDSFVSLKKGKNKNKRHINQRDARYIKSCRTEKFACISSFIDEHQFQNTHSQSSIDRITVIGRQDDFQEINKKFSNQSKTRDKNYIGANNAIKLQKRRTKIIDTKLKNSDKKSDKTECHDKLDAGTTSNKHIKVQRDKNFEQNEKKKLSDTSVINNRSLQKKSTVNSCQLNTNKDYNKLISPDYSEPSKCNLNNKIFNVTDKNNLEKSNNEDVTGITKVVLSEGQKIVLTEHLDTVKRKPRLTTTLPNNSIIPKLTQTEIKRRLSCMRFPLTILGKDQVSSSFKVEIYDPPQFEGLKEHIWPFMKNWFQTDRFNILENHIKESFSSNKCNKMKCITDKIYKDNNYNNNNRNVKRTSLRERKIDPSIPIRTDKNSSWVKESSIQKIRPMSKVKNKMKNFIHKKTDSKTDVKINNINTHSITDSQNAASIANDIGTNTQNSLTLLKQPNIILKKDEKNNTSSFNKSYQRVKRKWAGDFIDNVIKKIKSGVYFYQEEEPQKCKNLVEESAQTETVVDTSCESSLEAGNMGPVVLPGFDDKLSDLEIETIENYHQIAVKHCVTNTVIQFDIALKSEFNNIQINKSFSCIPLQHTDNLRIFKCKAAIINAVLPADLCTVLPNLMQKILKTNYKLVFPTSVREKVDDSLPPITEITQCESLHVVKRNIPKQIYGTSDEGTFDVLSVSVIKNIVKDNINRSSRSMHDLMEAQGILMRIQMNLLKNVFTESPILPPILGFNPSTPKSSSSDLNSLIKPSCLTVQPYFVSNKRLYPAFKNINLMSLAESLLCHQFLNINVNTPLINNFKIILHNDNISIRIETINIEESANINYNIITNVQSNSIYNGIKSSLKNNENKDLAYILDKSTAISEKRRTDKRKLRKPSECCVSNKRRGFIKLYKKCKSMSNLQNEGNSTALNKITNLDEFLLALETSKALSSVLDGNLEKKIMLAINEMKNWTTDITPRQALLFLLLAHKKDTLNLIRYRPVILQGIAVNRITRNSELDLEIEVIARENLNGFSKYDGINYLSPTVEDQENLFEELCWIAKTTASDYQKIFDESSEKHLKLLLEKRKKLSPSYLRVMARYIGLGLLKPPKQCR